MHYLHCIVFLTHIKPSSLSIPPKKNQEKRFSDLSRRYKKEKLVQYGLIIKCHGCYSNFERKFMAIQGYFGEIPQFFQIL